jgi:hypothetical protein
LYPDVWERRQRLKVLIYLSIGIWIGGFLLIVAVVVLRRIVELRA